MGSSPYLIIYLVNAVPSVCHVILTTVQAVTWYGILAVADHLYLVNAVPSVCHVT